VRWSLAVVDLRPLIAFQRRITLSPDAVLPCADDWPALLKLSFGSPKPVQYESLYDRAARAVTMRSSNLNLHIRIGADSAHPLTVHGGGPFFEVARLRNRWFLRDGYHRAFALLQAGIFAVPAVVIEARTVEELGADEPWFFSEEVLFSETPPMVVDFLSKELTISYQRPPLMKTLHIKIEETLMPETYTGEPS
jgi:hypothetical protein